jgi:hypothetical protein
MSLIARVKSWLRVSSRRADFEREMQDEMRTHLELYQADLRRRGVPEEEARRRALAEFGSVDARREECRDAVGLRLVDELRGDVGYAFRLLRRSLAGQLFGVTPRDPVAIAVALSVLGVVTLAAGYLPAHRASRIDPVRALRAE